MTDMGNAKDAMLWVMHIERQTEAAKKEEERAEEGWGQGGQQRHEC